MHWDCVDHYGNLSVACDRDRRTERRDQEAARIVAGMQNQTSPSPTSFCAASYCARVFFRDWCFSIFSDLVDVESLWIVEIIHAIASARKTIHLISFKTMFMQHVFVVGAGTPLCFLFI